jgi:hypothetical protein
MKHSKKSDEQCCAVPIGFEALLIGCNFYQNSASYIAGVVEENYTTRTEAKRG